MRRAREENDSLSQPVEHCRGGAIAHRHAPLAVAGAEDGGSVGRPRAVSHVGGLFHLIAVESAGPNYVVHVGIVNRQGRLVRLHDGEGLLGGPRAAGIGTVNGLHAPVISPRRQMIISAEAMADVAARHNPPPAVRDICERAANVRAQRRAADAEVVGQAVRRRDVIRRAAPMQVHATGADGAAQAGGRRGRLVGGDVEFIAIE